VVTNQPGPVMHNLGETHDS